MDKGCAFSLLMVFYVIFYLLAIYIVDVLSRIKFQNVEHYLWFICTLDHKFRREERNLPFEENDKGQRGSPSPCALCGFGSIYISLINQ